jgi:phage virion morphogenesis protein
MARDTADASPAFEDIADYIMDITRAQFESQGRRAGGSWKQLTQKWLKFKLSRSYDPRILHLSHRLRDSVTFKGAAGQILEIGATELNFGSNLAWAKVHQYGYPPRNIPARPFLKFRETDRRNIRNMIRDHIMQGTS